MTTTLLCLSMVPFSSPLPLAKWCLVAALVEIPVLMSSATSWIQLVPTAAACSVSMDVFCDYFVVTLLCCALSLVFSSDVLHMVMYGACALLICWRRIQLFAVIFFLAPGAGPLIPTQWPLMLTMFNCIKKCHLSMSLDADVWLC